MTGYCSIKTLVVVKLWIKLEAAQATLWPQLKFGEAVPTSNYIELACDPQELTFASSFS